MQGKALITQENHKNTLINGWVQGRNIGKGLTKKHYKVAKTRHINTLINGLTTTKKTHAENRQTRDTENRQTRDANPGLLGESPVFYPSTTPTNLFTRAHVPLYYKRSGFHYCNWSAPRIYCTHNFTFAYTLHVFHRQKPVVFVRFSVRLGSNMMVLDHLELCRSGEGF